MRIQACLCGSQGARGGAEEVSKGGRRALTDESDTEGIKCHVFGESNEVQYYPRVNWSTASYFWPRAILYISDQFIIWIMWARIHMMPFNEVHVHVIEESFAFLVSFQSIWVYGWKYSSIRWLWRQTPLILVTNAAFWHSGLETVAVASDNEQKNPRRSVFQPSGSCWLAVDTDRHVMQSRLWRMINVLIFASKPSVPGQQKPPKIASRHVIDFIRDAPEPQLWADFRLHPAFLDVCNDDCCFWRKMPGFLFGRHAIRMNQNWKCKNRFQF